MPSLSWRGRVMAINQFIAPKLWFILQANIISNTHADLLQKQLIELFWHGRKHWVTQKHLCLPIKYGGLGLVHIRSKITLFRLICSLKYLSCEEKQIWHHFLDKDLRTYKQYNLTWQLFFTDATPYLDKYTPPFLYYLIFIWKKFDIKPHTRNDTINCIREFPLINSSLLPYKIYSYLWTACGLTKIGQLLNGKKWTDLQNINMDPRLSDWNRNRLQENYKCIKRCFAYNYKETLTCEGPCQRNSNYTYQNTLKEIHELSNENRKQLLYDILLKYFEVNETPKGAVIDDDIYWLSFFNKLSINYDSIVAWRFVKNRLADTIFLEKCSLTPTDQCPWCEVRGTSWHLIIECKRTKELWQLVDKYVRSLLGTNLQVVNIYTGYPNTEKYLLTNFLLTLAKGTIYSCLLSFFKDNRDHTNYVNFFRIRLRTRIIKEFAKHKNNSIQNFKNTWCKNSVLCSVKNENLIMNI